MTENLATTPAAAPARRSLTATQVVAGLAKLEGWHLAGDGAAVAIEKTFHFATYYQTIAFVNAVAFIAHQQDHHPELTVHFGKCTLRYNTHDVGGISSTDFDCAASIEALIT